MSLTLYVHPLASFCHKVLIGLYENATPFEPRIVDFSDPASAAAHIDRWSVGKIPVLYDSAADVVVQAQRWLARHPRWTFHFTPTSSSWLDAVEGFFAKLTRRRLKYGVFTGVVGLQAANRFIAEHNETEAKPFVWRADPDAIIAARKRRFQAFESIH